MPSHGESSSGRAFWSRPSVVSLIPAIAIFAIYLINSRNSYDFSLDELTYAKVTQQVIGHNAISTATNPFLVHPPLYFLLGGLWNFVTGNRSDSPLHAIYSLRHLQALVVALGSWVAGVTLTSALRATGARVRLWYPIAAMAMYALSAFVLSFGRAVILEALAVLAGELILLTAIRLRGSPGVHQICALGALIGVGCLVKQTVVFAALAPLLAAVLRRDFRAVRIQIGAVVVGALVWCSFLVWGVTQGHGHDFISQQTVSLRRLFGVLQTSGVNRASPGTASALDDVKATLLQYIAGYALFVGGALALFVLAARRDVFARRERLSVAHHLVLSFGLLQYVFVAFSFAFGQGNQQLIMYSAGAGAIAISYACVVRPRPQSRRSVSRVVVSLGALLAVGGTVGGAVTFGYYYVGHNDNATTTTAAYVRRHFPGCVPINATGDSTRWDAVLPNKDVTGFDNAAQALQAGTQLFLVSTKDAAHAYGDMSPQFARQIATRGTVLYRVHSRSYGSISLFRIGAASSVHAVPQVCARTAKANRDAPRARASAGVFALLLGSALVVVAAAAGVGAWLRRRRSTDRTTRTPAHAREPTK